MPGTSTKTSTKKKRKARKEMTMHISPRSVVTTVLILLAFAIAFILRDLILVVLAAVVIAAAVEPAVRWFSRNGVPRLPAVLIIYIILGALVAAAAVFLLQPLVKQALGFLNNLPQYLQGIQAWSPGQSGLLGEAGKATGLSEQLSVKEIIQEFRSSLTSLSSNVFSTILTVFGGLFSFILIVVLSFYLSVQQNGISNFLRMITPKRHESYVLDLWSRSQEKIGRWMQGQLILVVIIGVITYLGLLLIGVQHALLLAFLAGIAELIPLFGPIIAAIPAIIIAFTTGDVTLALVVTAFYVIVQQFENHLIYPLVVKKVVGLSPIIIILALVAGGQLAGFLGVLLSVPVAAILMEFLNDFEKKSKRRETMPTAREQEKQAKKKIKKKAS